MNPPRFVRNVGKLEGVFQFRLGQIHRTISPLFCCQFVVKFVQASCLVHFVSSRPVCSSQETGKVVTTRQFQFKKCE
jgi:hypothetical protein